jgi:hypothetical protein
MFGSQSIIDRDDGTPNVFHNSSTHIIGLVQRTEKKATPMIVNMAWSRFRMAVCTIQAQRYLSAHDWDR